MEKTILLTNKYVGTPMTIVNNSVPNGFRLLMLDELTKESMERHIGNANYLLASGRLQITDDLLEKAVNLKMIQRTGVGTDSLDLKAIKRRGIPLYVNQGINAESVAEYTLLVMLSSLRRLTKIDLDTKNGIWKKQEQGTKTHTLRGKTVGIIGMGNIADRLISLLDAFDVTILYYDVKRRPTDYEKKHSIRFVPIEELMRESDIITLHCALTENTRGMINRETISEMKDGVIMINTSRGPIVEENDLYQALKSGKIGYAAIDAHASEPFSKDYSLCSLDNVILTPHIAGITFESFSEMMLNAMRNIELFEKGQTEQIEQYRYL